VDDTAVAFAVDEATQGADLNSDGDVADVVIHVYEASTGVTINLGIAGFGPIVDRGRVVFFAGEQMQGADLNQDGDMADSVAHLYDVETRSLLNFGLAAAPFDSAGT
jgi:hypothetical protein